MLGVELSKVGARQGKGLATTALAQQFQNASFDILDDTDGRGEREMQCMTGLHSTNDSMQITISDSTPVVNGKADTSDRMAMDGGDKDTSSSAGRRRGMRWIYKVTHSDDCGANLCRFTPCRFMPYSSMWAIQTETDETCIELKALARDLNYGRKRGGRGDALPVSAYGRGSVDGEKDG